MNGLLLSDLAVEGSILLDEAGIETGVFGEFRLKSAYAPVFARRGAVLVPVALAARLRPMLRGRALPCGPFLAQLATADRQWVERLGTELHLRNRHNAGAEHLDLHLRWSGGRNGPAESLRDRSSAGESDTLEVCPGKLVWHFRAEHEARALGAAASSLQRMGCRVGLEGFGSRPEMLHVIQQLRPEIVALDASWFRRLSNAPAAVHLFNRVVERLKQSGAQVMVPGIETPGQLRVALGAEADLLQGDHLAPPALAGIPVDTDPCRLSELLQQRGVVVPLFG